MEKKDSRVLQSQLEKGLAFGTQGPLLTAAGPQLEQVFPSPNLPMDRDNGTCFPERASQSLQLSCSQNAKRGKGLGKREAETQPAQCLRDTWYREGQWLTEGAQHSRPGLLVTVVGFSWTAAMARCGAD